MKNQSSLAVHNDQCYACQIFPSQINVYACSDWQLLRSMQLPCCDTDCRRHTITVINKYIKVCCLRTGRLIILHLDGTVKSIHGPDIEVIGHNREAANHDGSVKSRLRYPSLSQEDNEGNLLIADYAHHRLMLFTADCKWHDVTPDDGSICPVGASWLDGRLYVISLLKFITMFE